MNELAWVKTEILAASGLHRDALQIYAGLAIYLAASVALRRSLASGWPLLCVALVALTNEWITIKADHIVGPNEVADSLRDIWNMLFAPTALLFLTRSLLIRPHPFVRRHPPGSQACLKSRLENSRPAKIHVLDMKRGKGNQWQTVDLDGDK